MPLSRWLLLAHSGRSAVPSQTPVCGVSNCIRPSAGASLSFQARWAPDRRQDVPPSPIPAFQVHSPLWPSGLCPVEAQRQLAWAFATDAHSEMDLNRACHGAAEDLSSQGRPPRPTARACLGGSGSVLHRAVHLRET